MDHDDTGFRPGRAALRSTVPLAVSGAIAVTGAVTAGVLTPVAADAAESRSLPSGAKAPAGSARPQEFAAHTTTAALDSARITPSAVRAPRAGQPETPEHYTVQRGDTVSRIAAHYGLSTPAVLALNGLGWSTLIHPGQVLTLRAGVAPTTRSSTTAAPASTSSPVSATNTVAMPDLIYTVKSGDTVTGLAQRYGTTQAAIAERNGLTNASVIFAGQRITIPGAGSIVLPAQDGSTVTPLSPAMAANASTIIAVGRSLGVPDRGIVVALAAAMQESGLANLSGGDKDSIGLFQQRPSAGWGSLAQLTDPVQAARRFFGGPQNPNRGVTRGLLDVSGWQQLSVTQAAEAVQRSATPDAYARWQRSAEAWLAQLG